MKVAAFLKYNKLFCVRTEDIQGLYPLSSVTEVILESMPDLKYNCYNTVLNQAYYVYAWDTSSQANQACFLLRYRVAFPFEKLIGVFDIEDYSPELDNDDLFNLLSESYLPVEGAQQSLQLLNVSGLPASLKKQEQKQNIDFLNATSQEYSKKVILSSGSKVLNIPFESVKKVLYRPALSQRYPIKSNVLGQFKDEYGWYDSICIDGSDVIHDLHVVLIHKSYEFVLNVQTYQVSDTTMAKEEMQLFEEFLSNLPRLTKNTSIFVETKKSSREEDFLFYKNELGTCAIEPRKIAKISVSSKIFDILLQSGETVYATEVLGMFKAELKTCHGILNNKIVVKEGLSAFYAHA